MQSNFEHWLTEACWRPDNDGQPFHITPHDPGGATNYGAVFHYWSAWAELHVMPHDLDAFQHADKAQIEPYLHDEIWRLVRGDDLPAGVDLVCAEIACLAGPGIAAECLQRALGVAPDRHIGPLTLLSARKADPATLIPQISRQFLEFAATTRDSSLFDRGWTRRMEDDARIALGWARQASIDQSTAPADQVTSPDTADQRNDASPQPAEQFGQSLAALKKDGSG